MDNPNYVRSLIDGRMRLRHPIFATENGLQRVHEALKDEKKISEIRPGQSSLLIIFDPAIKGKKICQKLEEALPELKSTPETKSNDPLKDLIGLTQRQFGLYSLLGALGLTTFFGFLGAKTAHIWTGAAFLALTTQHIWNRRKAM